MTQSITQRLTDVFALASLRLQTERLTDPAQHQEVREIRERYTKTYTAEEREFRSQYATRVEVAKRKLIDKAGSKTRDLQHPWFGHDRFDRQAIHRQAQRQVRMAHTAKLDQLDRLEANELEAVLSRAADGGSAERQVKRDFLQATDRRRGERRQPRPHRSSRQRER